MALGLACGPTLNTTTVGETGTTGDEDDGSTSTGVITTSAGPSTTGPSTTSPSTTDPGTTAPTTDPSTTDPSTTDPSTTDPSTTAPPCEPPSGTYGDCINGMAPDACGGSGTCIVDDPGDPMHGVCFIQGCTDVCDCWEKEPDDDSTSTVECAEIVDGGGSGCFLDCSQGKTCPEGMLCFAGIICMWEAQP